MQQTFRLILVDDHLSFLEPLHKTLTQVEGLEVIGTASNLRALDTLLHKSIPDLLIMDVQLPDGNGLTAAIALKKQYQSLKILLFSGFVANGHIEPCRTAGIEGWLNKSVPVQQAIETIFHICKGGTSFPEVRLNKLLTEILTSREHQIIQQIANHKTNEKIAEMFHLSKHTVEAHRKNIMRKLGLKRPGELMEYIIKHMV